MPLEFPCQSCGQQLSVPETATGKQAKCPQCETLNVVPEAPQAAIPPQQNAPNVPPVPEANSNNPYQSPSYQTTEATKEEIPTNELGHGKVDLNETLNIAVDRVKENIGTCIGVGLICIGLGIAGAILNYILSMVFVPKIDIISFFGQNMDIDEIIAYHRAVAITQMISSLIMIVPSAWIFCGVIKICLKLCRRQKAEAGEAFSGSPQWLSVVGIFFIYFAISAFFQIPTILGISIMAPAIFQLLGSVVTIIVSLYLLPVMYLIVERNMGLSESLSTSVKLMEGNKLTTFLLIIIVTIIAIIGAIITCLLGLPLVAMFVYLSTAAIYLQASGQMSRTTQ